MDDVGRQLEQRTAPARGEGFGELVARGRSLGPEWVWVLEDCLHVSGPFEPFLIDDGESVVRLPPWLMADARHGVREPGTSDPIDALAVARAALHEGLESLPVARLAGAELEVRLLVVHRERLVGARTRLIDELRWQLHDLWPQYSVPNRVLVGRTWQTKVARRLQRAEPTLRVRIGADLIRRVSGLTRTSTPWPRSSDGWCARSRRSCRPNATWGVLIAAKLIGEIAGIQRLTTNAQLALLGACAPIPVSSGRTDRSRLDPGGNRQLKHAIHMLALTKISHDPRTALYTWPNSAPGARPPTKPSGTPKRHLIRRVYNLLAQPDRTPGHPCLQVNILDPGGTRVNHRRAMTTRDRRALTPRARLAELDAPVNVDRRPATAPRGRLQALRRRT